MVRHTFTLAILLCCGLLLPPAVFAGEGEEGGPAHRISRRDVSFENTRHELGGFIGAWNLDATGSAAGLRVTTNKRTWLAWEVEGSVRAEERDGARPVLFQSQVRLGGREPVKGTMAFLIAGIAVGSSESFHVSPVVGAGFQSRWDRRMGVRGELQLYRRGTSVVDRGRVLLSLVAGF